MNLQFFGNAEFRAARPRIVFRFFFRGQDRFSVYLFYRRLAFRFVQFFVRRINQVFALFSKKIFDDSIFQRVEGDHCESASDGEAGYGLRKRFRH